MTFGSKCSVFGYFLIINIFFSILLAIRYFSFLPELPSDIFGVSFILTSLIGQMALLGGILGFFTLFFVFLPRKLFYLVVSLLASTSLFVLLIDTFVFAQYRFHINEVVLKLVLSGDVVDFSTVTWLIAVFSFLILYSFLFYVFL
jgi:membrane-anchored protein YejM (alkaline phosphatase superfamily)